VADEEIKALLSGATDSHIEFFVTGYVTGPILQAEGIEFIGREDGYSVFTVDLVPGRKFRIKVELVE
jgi:hypothetical protein